MNAILRRRLKSTGVFVVLGIFVGIGVGLVFGRLDQVPLVGAGTRGVAIGALIGLSLGVGEEFLVPRLSRRLKRAVLTTRYRLVRFRVLGMRAMVWRLRMSIAGRTGSTLVASVCEGCRWGGAR